MRKAHKIIYIAAGIFVLAAALAWIFAAVNNSDDSSYREINGFVLDKSQPHNIDLSQIAANGAGRDGIPAISQPQFVPIADAPTTDETPGILAEHDGEQHFYPYNIIAWHQVVNDYLGSTPVLVVYSPQCDTAAAYQRLASEESIWFGNSGLSYQGAPLLYDDATKSLWQPSTGQALIGPRFGLQMERLPTKVLTWGEAKSQYPAAISLGGETGFDRDYSSPDYPGKNRVGSIEDACK